jgi:hypothetical protein
MILFMRDVCACDSPYKLKVGLKCAASVRRRERVCVDGLCEGVVFLRRRYFYNCALHHRRRKREIESLEVYLIDSVTVRHMLFVHVMASFFCTFALHTIDVRFFFIITYVRTFDRISRRVWLAILLIFGWLLGLWAFGWSFFVCLFWHIYTHTGQSLTFRHFYTFSPSRLLLDFDSMPQMDSR